MRPGVAPIRRTGDPGHGPRALARTAAPRRAASERAGYRTTPVREWYRKLN